MLSNFFGLLWIMVFFQKTAVDTFWGNFLMILGNFLMILGNFLLQHLVTLDRITWWVIWARSPTDEALLRRLILFLSASSDSSNLRVLKEYIND